MSRPEPEVFVLAEQALCAVVAQVSQDQWGMTMPANFAMRQSTEIPSLWDIINYHAFDDAWVPDMLAGLSMAEAGADRFDGDLLGDDPLANFTEIAGKACAAADRVRDLEGTASLSFGDFTIREYFWQINSFRALRAHDLAQVIGADLTLPDELVQGIWDEVSPHAEEWRGLGVYPAAVPVPGTAPLLVRLLGLTGRDPYAG
ncbi:MAG TPA: hypothetical protein VGL48_16815 [Acidimicrobiales bacterium]|jgi:hypothetical protein